MKAPVRWIGAFPFASYADGVDADGVEMAELTIKEWWPRLSFEAKSHLRARLREPLDMASRDALLAAGVLTSTGELRLDDADWTWIEQYG
jgi:hypothetical protein